MTPEVIARFRRPLEDALAAAAVTYPQEVAEMWVNINVRPGPTESYVGWLSMHHPVLSFWCSVVPDLERRLGRRRRPEEFTPRPLLDALEQLYRFQVYVDRVQLPPAPIEWREIEGELRRSHKHYRRVFG